MSDTKKVLAVVDDHPIVIEGLKFLLKTHADFGQVFSFTSGAAFMHFSRDNRADIVLLDISLPDANGVELCREIKSRSPETVVLGLSNQAERSIILQMLESGAGGYLLKSTSADELLENIEAAQHGELVFCNEVKKILAKPGRHPARQLPSLTKREKQLVQLLAQGKTTAMIAAELELSRFTIDTYRKNLLHKFDVRNITELMVIMMREKLL
ncbi:DNA-binding response regulator [Chitinophaga lutea]|uniref:DNA-binding response regulator n=1 Tax=Chitinophaga lutea TaxID=2488634 RepID=A0A3N4PJW2_9BACT|nr:response regulator transcription factor [Chitinophaga lutea]RPE08105.1 DNA-binding response regulator [Chitinophaga lutea]